MVTDILAGGRPADLALQQLITEVRDKFIGWVINKKGDKEDAKDVFQEGMLTMVMQLEAGKYTGEGSLTGYLWTICKRRWYKLIERKRKGQYSEVEEVEKELVEANVKPQPILEEPFEVMVEPDLLDREKYSWVKACFRSLKESCIKVMELIYLKQISREEVA